MASETTVRWESKRLGEIADQRMEKASVKKDTTLPYIGLEQLQGGDAKILGTLPSSASTSVNAVFRKNDVLFGKLRPNLRKSVLTPFEGYCSTDILVLAPTPGNVPAYVARVFQSDPVYARATKTAFGTKMPRTSWADLRSMECLVPNESTQRRIAEILDTVDACIRGTEQVIAKLQAAKQGLVHDLLTRGVDEHGALRKPREVAPELYRETEAGWVPRGWEVKPLEWAAEVSRGKFTYRPRNEPRLFGGHHPFIQTGDVVAARNEIIETYDQTLNEFGLAFSKKFPTGTIAVTIAANIADTAILGQSMCFPDSVVGVVVKPSHNVRFVELSIRNAKPKLEARAPQSAQKNINLEDLRPLLIGFAPEKEQAMIAQLYDAHMASLNSESTALAKLHHLKQSLMSDLLTGKGQLPPSKESTHGH